MLIKLLGTCSVLPLSGVSMETNFTLSCENWVDNESPLAVEFSYQIKGVKTVFFFRDIPNGARVSATLWLPAGDENSDYRLDVSMVVKDRIGAKVTQDFAVEVLYFQASFVTRSRSAGFRSGKCTRTNQSPSGSVTSNRAVLSKIVREIVDSAKFILSHFLFCHFDFSSLKGMHATVYKNMSGRCIRNYGIG